MEFVLCLSKDQRQNGRVSQPWWYPPHMGRSRVIIWIVAISQLRSPVRVFATPWNVHARLPCPPIISFFPLGVLAAFSPKLLSLITLLTCPDTKDGWRFHTHSGSYQTRIPTSDVLRMESQIFRVSEHSCTFKWGSLVAQLGKKSPAKQETLVRFLGQQDPLEEEMATHSSALE